MSREKLEACFLERLSTLSLPDHHVSRNDQGLLVVTFQSPCPEVGYLAAVVVDDREIFVTSKITHFHCDTHREMGEAELREYVVDQAAERLSGIFAGRLCFTIEYKHDGSTSGGGLCPADRLGETSPEYDAFLVEHYGGPSTHRAWSWLGEIPVGA